MKRILAVAILVGAIAAPTLSQTASKQADHAKAEQELIQLDKAWADANQRGDATALGRILADDYISVEQNGGIAGKAQDIANIAAANDGTSAAYDEYVVHFFGDTAVMTHRTTITGKRDGKDVHEMRRSMHVWVKRDGRWQAAATQATPIVDAAHAAAQP